MAPKSPISMQKIAFEAPKSSFFTRWSPQDMMMGTTKSVAMILILSEGQLWETTTKRLEMVLFWTSNLNENSWKNVQIGSKTADLNVFNFFHEFSSKFVHRFLLWWWWWLWSDESVSWGQQKFRWKKNFIKIFMKKLSNRSFFGQFERFFMKFEQILS